MNTNNEIIKKFICVIILSGIVIYISGCTFVDSAREQFIHNRDFDIGRNVNEVPLPKPYKKIDIDTIKVEYYYRFFNDHFNGEKCEWVYLVDKRTNHILSWYFISVHDSCYRGFQWGEPW